MKRSQKEPNHSLSTPITSAWQKTCFACQNRLFQRVEKSVMLPSLAIGFPTDLNRAVGAFSRPVYAWIHAGLVSVGPATALRR